MSRPINWFGLAAGMLTVITLFVSFFIPWWQLEVGQDIMKVNASPVNTNFGLFGLPFTIPLISALNIISILLFAASGITMLVYSFVPTKPYAKHLLGFAYKKPLIAVISFLLVLVISITFVSFLGINVPFVGSATVDLPSNLTDGIQITASLAASFQISFWFAVAASALCIIARFQHFSISKGQ